MNKELAQQIKSQSLKSIEELTKILYLSNIKTVNEYETLKKSIGLLIGSIQTDVLDKIYKLYPEIDDLKLKGL